MTPGEAAIQAIERHHATAVNETLEQLLYQIPEEGGHVSRNILETLIRQAFLDGVLTEREKPFGAQN